MLNKYCSKNRTLCNLAQSGMGGRAGKTSWARRSRGEPDEGGLGFSPPAGQQVQRSQIGEGWHKEALSEMEEMARGEAERQVGAQPGHGLAAPGGRLLFAVSAMGIIHGL